MNRFDTRWGIILLLILLLFGWQTYLRMVQVQQIPYTTFVEHLENSNVQEVTVQGDEIEGTLKEPAQMKGRDSGKIEYTSFVTYVPSFGDPDLLKTLREHRV